MTEKTGNHSGIDFLTAFTAVFQRPLAKLMQLNPLYLQAHLARAILLLAAVVALYFATLLFWQLVPVAVPSEPVRLLPLQLRQPARQTSAELLEAERGLSQLYLFGKPGTKVADSRPKTPPALVPLTLKLTGIVYASDLNKARAMISHSKDSGNYRIGDLMPGGQGVLENIEKGHIEIRRGDQLDKLYLYSSDKEPVSSDSKPTTDRIIDDRTQRRNVSKIAGQYLSQLHSNPVSLAETISFRPVKIKNKILGYRISALRNLNDFSTLGFQNNDVVTAVNGISLDSLVNINQIRQSLKNDSGINFEIKRQNQEVELKLLIP